MTRDDIINMAREAGWDSGLVMLVGNLEVFAALVAAAEREACVKVCVEVGNRDSDNHAWDAAAAIRARDSHDRP